MYENSVIICASDNGGSPTDGGNNWPFRGSKKTYNEGGVHVPAFVHSPLIPASLRGRKFQDMVHVTDWLPTIVFGIADGSSEGLTTDGVNIWPALLKSKDAAYTPRSEILLNINYMTSAGDDESNKNFTIYEYAPSIYNVTAALIMDIDGTRYKLLWGTSSHPWYQPHDNKPQWPSDMPHDERSSYQPKRGWLFDISSDPREYYNLHESEDEEYRRIVDRMSARMCEHYSMMQNPQVKATEVQRADDVFENQNDGFVTFWQSKGNETSAWPKSGAPTCVF